MAQAATHADQTAADSIDLESLTADVVALAMKAGASEGMQHLDSEIAQLVRERVIDLETGLFYASNPTVLGQELAR